MPSPSPDPKLRRLVADLAMLHADDISAVLGALGAKERATVEGLLREHANYFGAAAEPAPPQPVQYGFDMARLSLWLAQRAQERDASAYKLTDAARLALREVAARLYPGSVAPAMLPVPSGLLGRMTPGRAKP